MTRRPRTVAAFVAAALVVPGALALGSSALAATPASQDAVVPVEGSTATYTWTGTIPVTAATAGAATSTCPADGSPVADTETIALTVPAGVSYDVSTTTANFSISWDQASGNDEVLTVTGPGGSGGSADTSAFTETVTLGNPAAGSYAVSACGFAQVGPQDYTGTLTLTTKAQGTTPAGGDTGTAVSPTIDGAPTYANYAAPAGEADGAGEPSIGNDWVHDATVFQSNLDTYQVLFGPDAVPHGADGDSVWQNKSAQLETTSLDPILFTDSVKGRTFVSQLLLACSQAFYTDDITVTNPNYVPSQGCGAGTVFDHQTVGGGPYTDDATGNALATVSEAAGYGNAVYYCAQVVATASCARSDDGGLTFGAGAPIYNVPGVNPNSDLLECAGLHGHLRVAPDGSAYVPNFDCGGKVAASVSLDDGNTWNVRPVEQSTTQDESDPSIAADAGGTLYMGWEQGDDSTVGSKPFVGVSRDHGETWTNVTDVGTRFGISNIQFPEVIAGDDDRAAFAFIGTPTAGDDQQGGSAAEVPASQVFGGVWHMYVATTYDGGVTWKTVDATPDSPVQRGCVWLAGGSSSCRNLLDFNDITADKTGRILVGWADGCIDACETTPLPGDQAYDSAANDATYRANHGTITRQASGLTLFKAFDPVDGAQPVVPEVPLAALLPLAFLVVAGAFVVRRRRSTV